MRRMNAPVVLPSVCHETQLGSDEVATGIMVSIQRGCVSSSSHVTANKLSLVPVKSGP